MSFALWCVVAGAVLVLMALSGSVLRRLPLSAAMVYLAVGFALGPLGAGALAVDVVADARFLEHVTEVAVVVSLFTAGLKLRVPLADPQWRTALRLATASMVATAAGIAAAGALVLDLPLGAAVLLGAVLAPTDPVLAGDVQVREVGDRDRVRFGLTGEAGLNDGAAFPFVLLGLGLLGLHDLGAGGWRWWLLDVGWAVAGGLGIGFLGGTWVARLVLHLRSIHREAVGLDNFLALGLVALTYGTAVLLHAYGFLAVFAAGLALRRLEMRWTERPFAAAADGGASGADAATVEKAPASMTEAVLGFNEQVEKLLEVAVVVVLGALLAAVRPSAAAFGLAALLFLAVRPASVALGLAGSGVCGVPRGLIAWFGIRGVGSLYYLAFAVARGVPAELARPLADLVVTTVAVSIVVHGVSVTPVMDWYGRRRGARRPREDAAVEPRPAPGPPIG